VFILSAIIVMLRWVDKMSTPILARGVNVDDAGAHGYELRLRSRTRANRSSARRLRVRRNLPARSASTFS